MLKMFGRLYHLRPKTHSSPINSLKIIERFFYPKLIVNEFNNYFATMGSRLAAEIRSYGT